MIKIKRIKVPKNATNEEMAAIVRKDMSVNIKIVGNRAGKVKKLKLVGGLHALLVVLSSVLCDVAYGNDISKEDFKVFLEGCVIAAYEKGTGNKSVAI